MTDATQYERQLAELAEEYRLVAIYAFGSRAPEIAARVAGAPLPERRQPLSDVDIGVLPAFGHHLDVRDRVRIAIVLEDLFDVERVDLVVLPEVSAFLALDVVTGELLYTTDPDTQAEYRLYVLRRAADLAPFERERRRLLRERMAI